MRRVRGALLSAVFLGVLASCGGVTSTTEFKDLQSQFHTVEGEINEVNSEITSVLADLSAVQREVDTIRNTNNSGLQQVNQELQDSSIRKRVMEKLVVPACVKFESEKLNQLFLTDEYSKMSENAAASLNDSEQYWYTKATSSVNTANMAGFEELRAEFGPLARKCKSDAETRFYSKCVQFDALQVKKNPDKYTSKCLKGRVRIAQMDSATGPCAFQGYLEGGADVRAQFGDSLDPARQISIRDCEWLDALVEGKTISYWAIGIGPYTYETTSGQTLIVPAFRLIGVR